MTLNLLSEDGLVHEYAMGTPLDRGRGSSYGTATYAVCETTAADQRHSYLSFIPVADQVTCLVCLTCTESFP